MAMSDLLTGTLLAHLFPFLLLVLLWIVCLPTVSTRFYTFSFVFFFIPPSSIRESSHRAIGWHWIFACFQWSFDIRPHYLLKHFCSVSSPCLVVPSFACALHLVCDVHCLQKQFDSWRFLKKCFPKSNFPCCVLPFMFCWLPQLSNPLCFPIIPQASSENA